MPRRLFHIYQRNRLVNINFNVIASGLMAIAIAKYPVARLGAWIGPEHKLLITVGAAAIDMFVDVSLYYGLHWIANHWRPSGKLPKAKSRHGSFFKDATLIQFERAILSPLYYVVAGGLMYVLQHKGIKPSWAFVWAFSSGIFVTRLAHTLWGLQTGRFRSDHPGLPEPGTGVIAPGPDAPAAAFHDTLDPGEVPADGPPDNPPAASDAPPSSGAR